MSARRSAIVATPTPAAPALATPTRSESSSTSNGSALRRSRRFTTSHTVETDGRHDDPVADNDSSDSESGSSPDRTPTVPMIRRRNATPPMPHLSSSRRSVTMPAAPHTPHTPRTPSPSTSGVVTTSATARKTPGFTTLSTVAATPARATSVPRATPAPIPPEMPAPTASPAATPRTASTKRKLFHASRLSRSNSMASLATPSPDPTTFARSSSPLAPHLIPLDPTALDQSDQNDYRAMLNALVARACRRSLSKSRFLRACAVLRPILDRDAVLQVARVDLDDLPVPVNATPLAGNPQTGMDVEDGADSSGSDTDAEAEDRRLVAQLTAITAFPKRHTAPPLNRLATPRSDSLWPSHRSGTGAPPPPPDAGAAGTTPTQPFDPLANLSHLELAAPDRNLLMRRWQRHRRPATMATKAETAGQKKTAVIDVSDSDSDNDERAASRQPPPPKATPPTPDALDRILLEVSATSHATSTTSVGMASKHMVGAGGRAVKKRKLRTTKPVGYAEAGHA